MQAAVLRQFNAPQPFATSNPLSIEEIELLPPRHGEFLVKMGGGGVCHSDLSVINADRPRNTPVVMGHEGAGEIVECGPGNTDLKQGAHDDFQISPSSRR